jgi:hypothetical protein
MSEAARVTWLTVVSILVLAACFLSQGCAAAPNTEARIELPAHVDVSPLSESAAASVLYAADQWYIATDGGVDLASNQGRSIEITIGHVKPGFDGFTQRAGGEYHILADFSEAESDRQIMVHEIGHVLGLPHKNGTLMGSTSPLSCIDAHSLAQVCERYACGPNAHPTCE